MATFPDCSLVSVLVLSRQLFMKRSSVVATATARLISAVEEHRLSDV